MSGRAPTVVLAVLFAAGCGDSSPRPAPDAADVKGTPFLAKKPIAPAPEATAIGDTDAAKPADPVVAPVPAAPTPAATTPAATTPAATTSAPAAPDSFESVTFDELSAFEAATYASESKTKYEIPAKILALSGKKVVIDGYMMPLAYEAGGAKKFLLMRYKFGCCYAVSPKINEWIEVTMEGGRVADYMPDTISTVWGVLDVKEELRDGVASGLYKIKGTRAELAEAK